VGDEEQRRRLGEAVVVAGLVVGRVGEEGAVGRDLGAQGRAEVARQVPLGGELGLDVDEHHCPVGGRVLVPDEVGVGGAVEEARHHREQLVAIDGVAGGPVGPQDVGQGAHAVEDEAPVLLAVGVLGPGQRVGQGGVVVALHRPDVADDLVGVGEIALIEEAVDDLGEDRARILGRAGVARVAVRVVGRLLVGTLRIAIEAGIAALTENQPEGEEADPAV
jgi:hypothetical protein